LHRNNHTDKLVLKNIKVHYSHSFAAAMQSGRRGLKFELFELTPSSSPCGQAAMESRSSVVYSSIIICHGFAQAGTTNDFFLRDHLEWLARATNWSKFTATASLGVIQKGHHKESMTILAPYLPQQVGHPPPQYPCPLLAGSVVELGTNSNSSMVLMMISLRRRRPTPREVRSLRLVSSTPTTATRSPPSSRRLC
jgi:hypothetical protein